MRNDNVQDEQIRSRMKHKADTKKSETRGWIISLLIAFSIALLLRLFVFEFISVSGPSMQPTLYSAEYVFMEKVTYWFREPEFGDVVICKFPDSTATYVKRVIGVGGDEIEIKDGTLYINGTADTTYFSGYIEDTMPKTVVPDDSVFVMGDNRNQSMDSRFDTVGPLDNDMVLGKALFIIWPLDQIRGL
jgi:signal peptidase I